jgi:hypothetical protein
MAEAKAALDNVVIAHEEFLIDFSAAQNDAREPQKHDDSRGSWLQRWVASEDAYDESHPIDGEPAVGKSNDTGMSEVNLPPSANWQRLQRRHNVQKYLSLTVLSKESISAWLDKFSKALSLTYIAFIRFARRSEVRSLISV